MAGSVRAMKVAGLAFSVVLLFAACGSDDDGDAGGDGNGDGASNGASDDISATATEFTFTPAAWTAPAGTTVSIDFTNGGALPHQWVVINLGEDLDSEADFSEDKALFEIEIIGAGSSTTESFNIAEPGTYQVICAVPTHFDAGMEGALTVS